MKPIHVIGAQMGMVAAIALVVFGAYAFSHYWGKGSAQLQRQTYQDQDQDGLTDKMESLYHTNPTQADTDGDGTNDGDEIAAGRNPLLAGDDAVKPPTGNEVSDSSSYTDQYLATLPESVSRDQVINKDALDSFVSSHRGELIPSVEPDSITVSNETGAAAVKQYFLDISSVSNASIISVTSADIEAAFQLDFQQQDPEIMKKLIAALEQNIAVYEQTPVPSDVRDIHERLLALNYALLNNVKLLHGMSRDFVGGLIAARNLHDLGAPLSQLSQDMAQAKMQYGVY